MPWTKNTTLLLKMLHWLPVSSRIAYKIDYICHTSLTTAYPKYLSEHLTVYTPADHCVYHQTWTSSTLLQQGPSHTVIEHSHTRHPAIGTESLVNFVGLRTRLPLGESWRHFSISRTKISKLFILFLCYSKSISSNCVLLHCFPIV